MIHEGAFKFRERMSIIVTVYEFLCSFNVSGNISRERHLNASLGA